mgnify:CR=1
MSGHSKWSTIKHKKEINDIKKGKVFSKLSVEITHAAKNGGGDPEMNPTLRLYIDKAKAAGFPIDRIEKAIEKGVGGGDSGVTYEEITFEGFGHEGIQILVDVLTDNRNRTVAELRRLFEEIGGRMAENGSVSWNFDTKGLIIIRSGHMKKSEKFGGQDEYIRENREEVMMKLMDIDGIEDMKETDLDGVEGVEIYTKFSNLAHVRDAILKLGYVIEEADIIKEPKVTKQLSGSDFVKAQEGLERLDDYDDVQNVWSNLEEVN